MRGINSKELAELTAVSDRLRDAEERRQEAIEMQRYETLLQQNIAMHDKLAKEQAEIDALERDIAVANIGLMQKQAKERRREQTYGKRQSLFSNTRNDMDRHVKGIVKRTENNEWRFRNSKCF